MTAVCREGHVSDEDDYCSVCGAAIAQGAATAPGLPADRGGAVPALCPSCGEAREAPDARFCEVCRYDFLAQKPGPPPVARPSAPGAPPPAARASSPTPAPRAAIPAPPPTPVPAASPPASRVAVGMAAPPSPARSWELLVEVDPSLDVEPDADSPCPAGTVPRVVAVDRAELLVGRHDDQRDIHPEIPVYDPGSSRRHAKFVVDLDGAVALQDLASTNGTAINGSEVPPGTRRRLREGDHVTLGRWTRITLRRPPVTAHAPPVARRGAPPPNLPPSGLFLTAEEIQAAHHLDGRLPAVAASRWSTPAWLRAALAGVVLASALLVLAGEEALLGVRGAIRTLGNDTAPSIIAAQEISSSLADLDANQANYLIGTKQHQAAALAAFEDRRHKVTERLVDAARNITYEAEKAPIHQLLDGFGRYLELAAQARYRYDAGDVTGAVLTYGAATELMHARILPSADALDDANRHELDRIYRDERRTSSGATALLVLVAALLLAVLAWSQVFLFRRTRRVFNVPLLAATAAAAVLAVYLIGRLSIASADLRVAKEDAFDSIHYLWQARAIAYDANGDESRFLMGGAGAQAFDAAFTRKVASLTTLPEPSAADFGVLGRGKVPGALDGLLGKELRNITFDGEWAAALEAVRTFAAYHAIDARLRRLERSGARADHDQAIELCIGTRPDESNARFDQFDAALLAVEGINRKAFDERIGAAEDDLGRGLVVVPVVALLIALLGYLGLRPRMREYNA